MKSNNSDDLQLPSLLASYSDLFHRLLDPTFLLDSESHLILDMNDICEQFLQRDAEELINTSLASWIMPAYRDSLERSLRIARRRYHPHRFDLQWEIFQNGSKKIFFTDTVACSLQLSNNNQVIQLIARDITRQHEAEEKVKHYLEELKTANAKLEEQAITDEMTGLANFRHFKNQLLIEHSRSHRYSTPYAIVFCDLDHFKYYNDHHGHPAGDELLKELGRILSSVVRKTDLAARYGGEEFAILCPNIDAKSAVILAERVRTRVEAFDFPHANQQPLGKVSLSIGIAGFPDHGKTGEEVLLAADHALYQSKERGRNRVTVYEKIPSKF